jgi:hypothetical protein
VVVMVTMVAVVVDGSGKCRTGKHNKKHSSPKLCHGENVARASLLAELIQKMPASRQEMDRAAGPIHRGAQAGPGVN